MPSRLDHARKHASEYTDTHERLIVALNAARIFGMTSEKRINASHFYFLDSDTRFFMQGAFISDFIDKECTNGRTMTYFEQWYKVDILMRDKALIVEIDGVTHEAREEKDARRDAILREMGYQIIRFKDAQLRTKNGVKKAVARIKKELSK